MENKEDIGTLLKKKLSNAKKTPKENLWNKINTSLNEKEKKKRALYFWISTGSITLIFIVLSIVSAPSIFQSETKNPSIETKISTSEKKLKETNSPKKEIDNEIFVSGLDSLNVFSTIDSGKEQLENNDSVSVKKQTEIKKKTKNLNTETEVTVSTTYYYSSSDKQIQTTNKSMIDSILKASQGDTLIKNINDNMIINDSIN